MPIEEITTERAITHQQRDFSPPDRPPLPEFPACPRCGRPTNREHFAGQPTGTPGQYITHLFCDHCDWGWQSLWTWRDFVWRIDSTITIRDRNVQPFLRHIESLTCV